MRVSEAMGLVYIEDFVKLIAFPLNMSTEHESDDCPNTLF